MTSLTEIRIDRSWTVTNMVQPKKGSVGPQSEYVDQKDCRANGSALFSYV